MSILNDLMREEYDRLNRVISRMEIEISELPKGYISEKRINRCIYYYLQFRENGKVKSIYLKSEEIDQYRRLISYRNELTAKLKELQADKKKLEKVLD
jgi:hypothetical protein